MINCFEKWSTQFQMSAFWQINALRAYILLNMLKQICTFKILKIFTKSTHKQSKDANVPTLKVNSNSTLPKEMFRPQEEVLSHLSRL